MLVLAACSGSTEKKPAPSKEVKDKTVRRDSTPLEKLSALVNLLSESDTFANGGFGFCLMDADSTKPALTRNPDFSLLPASAMKSITTGTALEVLGKDFHYFTHLQYDGELNKAARTLNGNIYIRGSGDPSLGSPVFPEWDEVHVMKQWVKAVKQLGIDSVKGAVVGDAGIFDDDMIPPGYAWEDVENDYGTGSSGLNFRENLFDVEIKCSKGGPCCQVKQNIPGLKLSPRIVVNRSEKKSYAYAVAGAYEEERTFIGVVNGDCILQTPVPDPPLFCASFLFTELKKQGIVVTDSFTTARDLRAAGRLDRKKKRATFCTIVSPPLSALVEHTNRVSQNLYAESFLRTLAVNESGYGSSVGGSNAIRKYWKGRGVNLRGFYMVDGNGVSRYDAVTARQLCTMLAAYVKDSTMFRVFYNSLPVCGEGSHLSDRLKGTCAESGIKAKGGYMTRVRTFAGYCRTRNGKLKVFAILGNNFNCDNDQVRDAFEKIMLLIAQVD